MLNKLLNIAPNIICAAIVIGLTALAVTGCTWCIEIMIKALVRLGGM